MIRKRFLIFLLAIPICLASVLVTGTERSHPASAGGVIDPACTSSLPCIEYDNNGAGQGVKGVSLLGNGLTGWTKFNSTSTSNSKYGVSGIDLSTSGAFDSGVYGQSVRGNGIFGVSTTGIGVKGTATSNTTNDVGVEGTATTGTGVKGIETGNSGTAVSGVATGNGGTGVKGTSSGATGIGILGLANSYIAILGQSDSDIGLEGLSNSFIGIFGSSNSYSGIVGATYNTSTSVGYAGVVGADDSNIAGSPDALNQGVLGTSTTGFGVEGMAATGTGVDALVSGTGTALLANSAAGSGRAIAAFADTGSGLFVRSSGTGDADADFATGSIGGTALIGASNGLGVQANGFASSSSTVPALNATCFAGAPAMTASNAGGDIMSLDCSGNMILAGTLTQLGTPLVTRRSAAGTVVGTFSAQQTTPTVEDLGEAQLVSGQAYVRLAPDFAATIDRQTNYLVFITPQGETRGLYVTQKTPAGFSVREIASGTSTLAFDYRIVAKPYGESSRRLPALNVKLRTDPSMLAIVRRAALAKAHARAELARARDLARLAGREQRRAQAIRQQAKSLRLQMRRPR